MKNKVLHINSEYATNPLYRNLIHSLDKFSGIDLVNFAAIKDTRSVNANIIQNSDTKFLYSTPLKKYHRLLYFRKMDFLKKDIKHQINLDEISLIHAHKLYSDGGVAYKIQKEYGIPYIVAVRNTDMNVFMRYMKHLKPYITKVLLNASKIVLISPAYEKNLAEKFSSTYTKIKGKIEIIPNGVSDYWFEHINQQQKVLNEQIRLLYAGSFDKNKNIEGIIEAAKKLKKDYKIKVRLVGDGGDNYDEIIRLAEKNKDFVERFPRANQQQLLAHYQESDIFVMPSHKETFGLVYVEALTQGLPIIYSEGQGVDGYFQESEVGVSVNSKSTEDIATGIKKCIDQYNEFAAHTISAAQQFTWDKVAGLYQEMYQKISAHEKN